MRTSALSALPPLLLSVAALGIVTEATGCAADEPSIAIDSSDKTEVAASIQLANRWVLKSDGLTEGAATIQFKFSLPSSFREALVAIGTQPAMRVTRASGDELFEAELDVTELEPGEHEILVGDPETYRAVGSATFTVSFPLYVVVSNDWDDTRFGQTELANMEELRKRHPKIRVTQFFAPYHYTDPEITEDWREKMDGWIKTQRDDHGDELGLHIHGWCHFVETTGVSCKTKETFFKDDGSGYTTILAAYSEQEMTRILKGAVDMFDAQDLGRPRSFRAGGWTADAKVLRALVNAGFTSDSSAVPAKYLSSWKGYGLYDFTTKNWEGIHERSQPYFPDPDAITEEGGERALELLEVPDNGVLVDYVTGDDMIRIFEMNYEGGALGKPTLYQVGFHSTNFSANYLSRLDAALDRVEEHLFDEDLGPARYVTIADIEKVWTRQR